MAGSPHQAALRRGRVSVAAAWYVITMCTHRRAPRLVPDPWRPEGDSGPPRVAIDGLRWLHGSGRIRCHAYVVMPDHLHVVMELVADGSVPAVVRDYRSRTARLLNRLQGCRGVVWQAGFYDHQIRDETGYARQMRYVAHNPVRKGFVERWDAWPWVAIEPAW